MLKEIMSVNTTEELERVSIHLLDDSVYHQLQEEMASAGVMFHRGDYWPEDILARKTSSPSMLQKTVSEVSQEGDDQRVLHLLQIVSVIAPGATKGIKRFLKRVTF